MKTIEQLNKLFKHEYDWSKIDIEISGSKERFLINATSMYEYGGPDINVEFLLELCDIFGTKKVDVDKDSISSNGCETCDYGSAYGHTFIIKEATKGLDILEQTDD